MTSIIKVLVVEDEDEVLKVLEKQLMAHGYMAIGARKGMEALEKADIYGPDLILLDLLLPDIDGADVVRLLKDNPRTAQIPVLFLSGMVTREPGKELSEIRVGGKDYPAIGKPFTFQELFNGINKVLG